jgi:hypothetical protein
MRRTLTPIVVMVVGLGVLACHTITEDLPSRPSSVQLGAPGSVPVVVVPIPQLTPVPTPSLVPSPSSPNAPVPRPTATPDNGGGGGGGGGGGEPPVSNTSPVAKLTASVYFVECGGAPVPNSSHAATAPVGCRVHLDVTPKDASNSPTNPRGTPHWTYSNTGIIEIGSGNAFNPTITGKGAGHVDMQADVDGIVSNSFGIDFQ